MCFINYVKAAYPLLWVKTFEESRAIVSFYRDLIKAIPNYKAYIWDVVDGMKEIIHTKGAMEFGDLIPETKNNPIKPLEVFSEDGKDKALLRDSGVLFLKDFTPYLQKEFSDSVYVTRTLRNIIPLLKASNKTIVILSPLVGLPIELEKEVTIVDFKLPTKEQLKALLKATAETNGAPLPEDCIEPVVNASSGMTIQEAENAFCISIVESKEFNEAIVRREKASIVKKSGTLEVVDTSNISLDDIGGLENLKEWLLSRRSNFTREAIEFGIKAPKGILLIGIPGGGKSLTAKAAATALNRPLLRLDMGRIFGSYVGESERNIQAAIAVAEAVSPCVLWIDEIEKGLSGNKAGQEGHETTKRVFQELLTWMQEKTKDVFLIATANSVSSLPPELLRAGRMDALFWVDLPDYNQRSQIVEIHLKKINRDPKDYDISKIVEASSGFTGAEIEIWVQEALVKAFHNKRNLRVEDFMDTVKGITPISVLMKDDIEAARKWAESHGCRQASQVQVSAKEVQAKRKVNLN